MPRQKTVRDLADPDDVFWSHVEIGLCWLWTGCIGDGGYGQASVNDRRGKVHRLAWELLVGPIPPGHDLDHLCRNRACVNPDHLEPVTRSVNLRRGLQSARRRQRQAMHAARVAHNRAHCKRGHPLSGPNLYVKPNGCRGCRICRADATRRSQQRQKEQRLATNSH